MPLIEVLQKGKKLNEVELKDKVIYVGREADVEIRLLDPDVSRRHARLIVQDGAYWVEDLGSTHGTFLNGRKAYKERLNDGDRVQVAGYILRFKKVEGEVLPHFHVGMETDVEIQANLKTLVEAQKTRPVSDSKRPMERRANLARTEPHFIRSKPNPPKLMAIRHVRNVVGMSDASHIREFAVGKPEAAVVERRPGGDIWIRKLGLKSNVKVNGETVSECKLEDGDNVIIGAAEFVFRSGRGVG